MTDPGTNGGPHEDDLDRVAERLAPLASTTRLKLLRFLARPHYLEEIASFLGVTRQAARKHLDLLVQSGSLDRRSGVRPSGPVTEYVVNPGNIFLAQEDLQTFAALRRDAETPLARTLRDRNALLVAGGAPGEGACFWALRGPGPIARFPLRSEASEWVIGRDAADVPLPNDPFASNRHAEVRREAPGYVLADLGSTNGTLHNWRPLARGDAARLAHGDVVRVGRTVLLFWDAPAVPAGAPRPSDSR